MIGFATGSQDDCLGTLEHAAGSDYPVMGRRAIGSDLMGGYHLAGAADIKFKNGLNKIPSNLRPFILEK